MALEWQVVEAAMTGVDGFSDAGHTTPTQLARAENVRLVRPGGFVPRTGFALVDNTTFPLPYSTDLAGTRGMNPMRLIGRNGEILALGSLRALSYTGALRVDGSGVWQDGGWSEKGRVAPGTLERFECHTQSEGEALYTQLGGSTTTDPAFTLDGVPKFADVATNGATYLVVWTNQTRIEGNTGFYAGLVGGHEVHYQLRSVTSRAVVRESGSLDITPGADRPDGVLAKCIGRIGSNGSGYVIVCSPRADGGTANKLVLTSVNEAGVPGIPVTETHYGADKYFTTYTNNAVWDVCEVPGATYFLLAFSDSDGKFTVQKRDNVTLAVTASAQFTAEPVGGLCVYARDVSSGVWITFATHAGDNVCVRLHSDLTPYAGFAFHFVALGRGIDHSAIVQVSDTVALVVVDVVNAGDTQDFDPAILLHRATLWGVIDQTAPVAWNPATLNGGFCQADMWLASRPWLSEGAAYCALHHDDVENGVRDTGYVRRLYDSTRDFGAPTSGEPDATRHIIHAGETVAIYHLGESDTPARSSDPDLGFWHSPAQYGFDNVALSDRVNCVSHVVTFGGAMPTWAAMRTVETRGVLQGTNMRNGFESVATAVDVVRILYQDTQVGSSAEFGDLLFIAGPVPQIYDGVRLFEYPFQTAGPELRGLSDTAGQGCVTKTGVASSLTGTYQYAACWRYIDARGNVYRSAPSQVVSRTVAGADEIAIRAAEFPAGALPPAAFDQVRTLPSPIVMEVYRSLADLAELHLLTDAPLPTDIVPSAASYVDDGLGFGADRALGAAPPLYTNGGEVANEPPPACKHVTMHKDRLWLATGEARLFFSKLRVAGRGPEFSSAFYVDLPEPIHATASLDSTLVAFGETGTYLVLGEGPDNNGGGSAFGMQRLPGHVTTHAPATIANTQAGVMFLACRRVLKADATFEYLTDGFYLLDRAYTLKKLGAPLMREFTGPVGQDPGPLVANAVCRSGATEVAWMKYNTDPAADSVVYVYDYGLDQWYTWKIKIPLLKSICEGISRGQEIGNVAKLSIRRLFAAGDGGDFWQDGAAFDQPAPHGEPVDTYFPIVLEGLTRIGRISGFQRARKFVVHARTTVASDEIGGLGGMVVSFAFDRDAEVDEPNFSESHQSTTWQTYLAPAFGLPGGYPQEFRFVRQKASVLKWRLETLLPQTPAMLSCAAGPYVGLDTLTLEVGVDAGPTVVVTFDARTSAAAVAEQINAAFFAGSIQGEAVVFSGSTVVIRSFSEGVTASVDIVTGTALAALGIATGQTFGVDTPSLPPQIYGVGLEIGAKRGIVKLPAGQRAV